MDAERLQALLGDHHRQRDTALPWTEREGELELDERWNEFDSADVPGANSPAAASLERSVGASGEPLDTREFQSLLDAALLAWIDAGADSFARESWPAFPGRCRAALTTLLDGLRAGEAALVFTSGRVISALAARLLGLPERAQPSRARPPRHLPLTQASGRGVCLVDLRSARRLQL